MSEAEERPPATFVLVHGAWHGGWCWRRVADRLERLGHKVFTPTLTGLGERSHLLHPGITLETHVTDIVNVLKWESLTDVVLVGHSYAGFVISGVAEQMPGALAALVYLDAFVPENGDAMINLTSEATREAILAAAQRGETTVPPRRAEFFRVNERDRAWVDALLTPHPIATLTARIALAGARDRVSRKVYIRATDYPNPGFDAACERARRDPAWRVYDLPCGHDVMIDLPDELAEILEEVA